jgi:NADH dehydrogenase
MKHVVLVGGGFGGLEVAKALRGANVRLTLIDRTNHHLFQPLLYQVAMAGLSPAEIAAPIRGVLEGQENLTVLLAEVMSVDLGRRRLKLRTGSPDDASDPTEIGYDALILATGAKTSYFGNDHWEAFAPGLKSLDDAVTIRNRVLMAFERAERTLDPTEKRALLNFVVIGGGPTGVELAGSIAELARFTLNDDFRSVNPEDAHVTLIEAGERLLPSFTTDLSASAKEQLEELGVKVRLKARVANIDAHGVTLSDGERVDARVVVWGAGVRGTRLLETLGAPLDKQGRVVVGADCSIAGHPEVFVIGDAARFEENGQALPGVSPVAMQQGRYVAKLLADEALGDRGPRKPFKYFDKGSMATIGRSRAIAQAGAMKLTGFVAWLAWLFIHVVYLIGFRSRVVVIFTWAWSYLSYRRGARLITERLPGDAR